MQAVPTPPMDAAPIQANAVSRSGFAPRRECGLALAPSLPEESIDNALSNAKFAGKAPSTARRRDRLPDLSEQFSKASLEACSKNGGISSEPVPNAANKTPVSVLQETLSRYGITPGYELVQIEGAIHQPTFRYRVTFSDKVSTFTAMGAGRSKKEAKHAAARALIEKVRGGSGAGGSATEEQWSGEGEHATDAGDGDAQFDGLDGDVRTNARRDINPISSLQDFCMQRRWPPPRYDTEREVGLPHERLFTIACQILNIREIGKGKSKKLAKRLAAQKMWERLQDNPEESENAFREVTFDLTGIKCDTQNFFSELKGAPIPILDSKSSSFVSRFLQTLSWRHHKELQKLQRICLKDPNIDAKKLLRDIAIDTHFEITFVDIEEMTINSKYQCLVQLSTMPVGVCHGTGDTMEEAQIKAAQNALEYLKIISKN